MVPKCLNDIQDHQSSEISFWILPYVRAIVVAQDTTACIRKCNRACMEHLGRIQKPPAELSTQQADGDTRRSCALHVQGSCGLHQKTQQEHAMTTKCAGTSMVWGQTEDKHRL